MSPGKPEEWTARRGKSLHAEPQSYWFLLCIVCLLGSSTFRPTHAQGRTYPTRLDALVSLPVPFWTMREIRHVCGHQEVHEATFILCPQP